MDSEKKQRSQKKEQIGDTIETELLPIEHTEKRGNKVVTVIKETAVAFVGNLKDKVLSFLDANSE